MTTILNKPRKASARRSSNAEAPVKEEKKSVVIAGGKRVTPTVARLMAQTFEEFRLTPAARKRLTPDQITHLRTAVKDAPEWMHDPSFDLPDAHKRLFEDVAPVPLPDTSWYVPVIERLGDAAPLKLNATLLTKEQERLVFLQFNYCRYRAVRIRKRFVDKPMTIKAAEALSEWTERAAHFRSLIADANLALVLAMIKRMGLVTMDFHDLISEGNLALLRAIDKFNVSKGFKFSTYACRAIIKALSRHTTKAHRRKQVFPVEFDPDFERSNHAKDQHASQETACVEELRRIIRDNAAELTTLEQQVIAHRFALPPQGMEAGVDDEEGPTKRLTLNQVGSLVGLTKERVRQIQNKAMAKLRDTLDAQLLN